MLTYQFFFRGVENYLVARHEAACGNDEAAISTALGRLAVSPHRGVEVWEDARMVYASRLRRASAHIM